MKKLNLITLDKLKWLKHIIVTEESIKADIRDLSKYIPDFEIGNKRLNLLVEAYQFKLDFYNRIKEDLVSKLKKKDFLSLQNYYPPELNVNPFTFKSLIRDWGRRKNYNQREIISSYLKKELQKLGISLKEKAVFLGCGNGGYVIDFAESYDYTYAFDNSLPMIWSTLYLAELKEWEVLQKVEKNCRQISDTIIKEKLFMTEKEAELVKNKIDFFVDDARTLSVKSSSINHIYSIYFTDVLPLNLLFKQVNRILKEKGLFIHFGPLDYFFTDEREMLTSEEIIAFFKEKNYAILVNKYFSSKHLFFSESMKYQTYDNWFFIAQKNTKKPSLLNRKSLIVLNPKSVLSHEIRKIDEGKSTKGSYSISNGDVSYELPEIIYQIIKESNNDKDIISILESIGFSDLSEGEIFQVLKTLQELINKKLINKLC